MITGGIIKKALGLFEGKLVGLAKKAGNALMDRGGHTDGDALGMLRSVIEAPQGYITEGANYPEVVEFARALIPPAGPVAPVLKDAPGEYPIFGAEGIEQGALDQMNVAMRLPIAVAGALMPDAHPGYGLPVGGVLATENAVIPYAVGVDIGCRMRMSIIDYQGRSPWDEAHRARYVAALQKHTYFGVGCEGRSPDHPIMDDSRWNELPLLRNLKDKALAQLGTSGGGNHFVEWGQVIFPGRESWPEVGLLSHSGSRGVGQQVAAYYSRLAEEACKGIDPKAKHLSWLSLDSEAGQEYWLAMNLMGDYAKANHEMIHRDVVRALGWGEHVHTVIENHHNFAWKEVHEGREVIVHRKGATPAGEGVLGVIPGSMADPGFVVKGKAAPGSLASASHGAGRVGSRKAALNSISKRDQEQYLRDRGVELLAGGRDEAPQAYKRIEAVMAAQTDLVEVLAKFQPRIVIMSDDKDN